MNKNLGQIGGHEGVGTVVAHGQGVTEPAIGSRVGIKWLADVCSTCRKPDIHISTFSELILTPNSIVPRK